MNKFRFFEHRTKVFWVFVGIGLVSLLGMIDYLTGYDLSFSLFYLIPILLVTWYVDGRFGLIISAASAIAWFMTDFMSNEGLLTSTVYLWNTIVRLGFFIIVTVLVSALRKTFNENQDLARKDFVTGAFSIRYFYELAEMELNRSRRSARPFSLIYIDLDNFKLVNDRFGHTTGDRLLKSVVSNVQNRIRGTDTFARLGGDEFALLLPEIGEPEAQVVADRLHKNITSEMQKNNWPVTFSLGVVTYYALTGNGQARR